MTTKTTTINKEQTPTRIIKKYPNRRLYDTQTSTYITLQDVRKLVLAHEKLQIQDAKTAEDLTRSILLQIILDLESGGLPMFSTTVLEQIIRFYGHAMQGVMGNYLEKNMQVFTEIQKQLQQNTPELYKKQFSPEAWTHFMNMQAPMLSTLMGNYLEQSKSVWTQMQQQTQQLLNNLYFNPSYKQKNPPE